MPELDREMRNAFEQCIDYVGKMSERRRKMSRWLWWRGRVRSLSLRGERLASAKTLIEVRQPVRQSDGLVPWRAW